MKFDLFDFDQSLGLFACVKKYRLYSEEKTVKISIELTDSTIPMTEIYALCDYLMDKFKDNGGANIVMLPGREFFITFPLEAE